MTQGLQRVAGWVSPLIWGRRPLLLLGVCGQLELTLLDDSVAVVSVDYARQIEHWVLGRISIEWEATGLRQV
ncbi:hypothetical protein ACFOET_15790 [Parapedobacter deserti]|uniref:Uncharacterized protein n=1 Tax=Parapedobacter deserti TaxID=1912957 RepID=A0ABV7JPR2_9SPHI